MALPENLTTDELLRGGYKIVSEGRAKHAKKASYRSLCKRRGHWFKQITNDKCRQCGAEPNG